MKRKRLPLLSNIQVNWGNFTSENYKTLYVYVDVTNDGMPFYVGKGRAGRVRARQARNQKHLNVANKHGITRFVVFSAPKDCNDLINDHEVELISFHGTFIHEPKTKFASNLTKGGEGTVGMKISDSERQARRERQLGENNIAKKPEVRKQISKSQMGRKQTKETREKIRSSRLGKLLPAKHRKNITLATQTPQHRKNLSIAKCKQNEHLLIIHDRLIELIGLNFQNKEISQILSNEFNKALDSHWVACNRHTHLKHKCRTCNRHKEQTTSALVGPKN